MEFIKSLIELITSFFKNSTESKKLDIVEGSAKETAIVEKIKSATNATAIQNQVELQNDLIELDKKHIKEHKVAKEHPETALDDQFGSKW